MTPAERIQMVATIQVLCEEIASLRTELRAAQSDRERQRELSDGDLVSVGAHSVTSWIRSMQLRYPCQECAGEGVRWGMDGCGVCDGCDSTGVSLRRETVTP